MQQTTEATGAGTVRQATSAHRYIAAGMILVYVVVCWLARPIGYLTGQDDIEYMTLGQSIRQGGYNLLFRVDSPVHAQYPPGYPAMLAAWGAVTGDGFDALALLSVLMSAGTLVLAYVAARRLFGPTVAIASLAVLALNPGMIEAGGNVASEAPFALLSMLSLVLLLSEQRGARYAGWAGATAILAALTRTVGIVLLGAIALHWLIDRRWKRLAIFSAASAVFVGGWLLWTFVSPEQHVGSSYVADLQAAVTGPVPLHQRLLDRIAFYASRALPYGLGVPAVAGTPVDNLVAVLLLTIGLGSGTWILLRRWRPAGLALLLYGGLLLLWTWRAERFLIPLVPILIPALLAGLSIPIGRRWPRAATGVIAVAAVLLVAGGAARAAGTIAGAFGCRDWEDVPPEGCVMPEQAEYFAAVHYIRENVPPGSVVLASKPGALWYYSGHLTISYPEASARAADSWLPYLREKGTRWILLGALGGGEPGRYARRLEDNCRGLRLERRFGETTYLFRLPPAGQANEDATDEAGEACEAVRQYRNVVTERP